MQGGVFPEPEFNRITLIHGATYTESGYGSQAQYLEGLQEGNFRAELRFIPGDIESPTDLSRFSILFSGSILDSKIVVNSVAGFVNTGEKILELLKAAREFKKFEMEIKEQEIQYEMRSEAEALKLEELFEKVAGRMSDIRREGKMITVKGDRKHDLGLLIAFIRYGKKLFD